MSYTATLTSALEYSQNHDLESWVHLFLNAEGNNPAFSLGLKRAVRFFHGPVVIPTAWLVRCTGPEPGMGYQVDRASFETRVGGILQALEAGVDLPPLIVEFHKNQLTVNDGNHRLEALNRLGRSSAPVILWASGAGELEEFLKRL